MNRTASSGFGIRKYHSPDNSQASAMKKSLHNSNIHHRRTQSHLTNFNTPVKGSYMLEKYSNPYSQQQNQHPNLGSGHKRSQSGNILNFTHYASPASQKSGPKNMTQLEHVTNLNLFLTTLPDQFQTQTDNRYIKTTKQQFEQMNKRYKKVISTDKGKKKQ
jgi:hypothetical protein